MTANGSLIENRAAARQYSGAPHQRWFAMDDSLIDRIYECAFAPDGWASLLGELAGVAGARAGFLFVSNGHINDFEASNSAGREAIRPLVESGWAVRSERFRRMLALPHAGFFRDLDIYTEDEIKHDPFYRDLLFPRGLGWGTATAVPLPTGDRFSINLEREYRLGPVEPAAIAALDALRPHLARAATMTVRLRLERAHAASETLAALGLPALVLAEDGKVLAANTLMESLTGLVAWRAFARASLKDRKADQLFRDAIAALSAGHDLSVRSFPVRAPAGEMAMVAHLVPVRLAARDIFVRCAAALVLTPVSMPEAPPVELVRSLFDLTPAEARVARALTSGGTVEAIAADQRLSVNTIRTQVRGLLEKTGCRRQTDLVAILGGISLSGGFPREPHQF